MLLPLFAFVFGTALVGGVALLLMPKRALIDQRLEELTARDGDEQRSEREREKRDQHRGHATPRS